LWISIPLWADWEYVPGVDVSVQPDFNSTMGWLGVHSFAHAADPIGISIPLWADWETGIRREIPNVRIFQFHYGLIGSLDGLKQKRLSFYFNSTMGWLGGRIAGANSYSRYWFQFHYGLIGSLIFRFLAPYRLRFQFHYGLIGREMGCTRRFRFACISIPLWADWEFLILSWAEYKPHFNSTMGWLGVFMWLQKWSCFAKFQFHYGLIGSSFGLNLFGFANQFQFHYGLIGRKPQHPWRSFISLFQFHYGLIGSTLHSLFSVGYNGISIPLWADWESKSTHARANRYYFNSNMGWLGGSFFGILFFIFRKFQFHYGLIGSTADNSSRFPRHYFNSTMGWLGVSLSVPGTKPEAISIPLWADWEAESFEVETFASIEFQFHYGLIGSVAISAA